MSQEIKPTNPAVPITVRPPFPGPQLHFAQTTLRHRTKYFGYIVFSGHDASRALGKTSTKPEDVSSEWSDLPDNEKKVLDDWFTFFSKRYNIVGVVEGAANL